METSPPFNTITNTPEFLSGGGELGQLIRTYDWSKTSLGPVETWPQSLRTCIRIMLTSRQPIWIGWGKELIKFYNDPYKAIVGGKHPWALGSPASVVWKDIWRDIEPMLKQVMEKDEGTYVESQLLIMVRNGYPEETYYTFSYTPIPGDDGGTAGMICANTDDTDRIISERQLKTLTQLSSGLTDAKSNREVIRETISTLSENKHDFPFALFYLLTDDKATFVSSTELGESIEIVPKEINLSLQSPVSELLHEVALSRKPQVLEQLQDVIGVMPTGAWEISSDKAIILPIVQPGAKDPYGFLVVGCNPYRLLDEKYSGFFSLVTDQIATSFSNVHMLEEERKRAEALAEIDRAKTTFFSNISHEFRTPLTLLLGPIEDTLNDEETNARNKSRMEVAYRNILRMQKLVNTLLEFSRIEAGRVEGKFTKVDIIALTTDLASTFRSAIEKAGMELKITYDSITDEVYVDIDMWEKIILNLVSNAFKYSHKGTISLHIAQSGDTIQVSVADTGIGIPEEELEKIFSRFHRIENIEGRSQEGTGIGLAMVQELVKIHKGSISVRSTRGVGSAFTIVFPTGKDHLPEDKITQSVTYELASLQTEAFVQEALKWLPQSESSLEQITNQSTWHTESESAPTAETYKNQILLADDNADMRDYVQRLLSDQFTVITATNGEDALYKMLQFRPELLISDIMMPKMDGFELLKCIRNHPDIKNTPVIFLSARAGEEAKVEGLNAGADDYLVKPFSAKELLVRVSNHIRINQIRRATEQQFYLLFRQTPAIINVLKGPEHRYEFFHPKNKELFGDKDFTGLTVKEALPDLGQDALELLDEVYRTGKTINLQEAPLTVINEQGESSTKYLNVIYQPWYALKGEIQGILNFAMDITETVQNRKKIEESEQSLNELANAMPQLVWVSTPDGEIQYFNNRISEFAGAHRLENGNWLWQDLIHPDDQSETNRLWQEAVTHHTTFQHEHRLQMSNGIYRWHLSRGIPQKDEQGNVTKWFGTTTDIHVSREHATILEAEVKKRTLELQMLNISLRKSNEDLQQFAHVASHDLKEPVRKIKTFSGRLQDEYSDSLPEQGKLFLEKIRNATNRMTSMIDGVLAYSKLNANEQHSKPIDLNEICRHIKTDLELLIQQKNAIINWESLPVIEGAAVLIYQLFYNLINNALKFSSPDRQPVISISSIIEKDNSIDFANIRISDNGIGFNQESAEDIFNIFTRLHSKDVYEGTGLGLALCKKIVERHHGHIHASSDNETGATFTVCLPLKQNEESI
ncbi:ATP-binding protein [Xanthocytophaga agilis]|uniref:histidine kinase n=1 Tax=Xanthocytophaga agilis TaxID=3048010 RepID=A0AAE3RA03_9BACT|nr:ATP-binding protein [Xanthocytophaga agilis]MDJ1504235.1 ATP-binding protein [Xanthocytophaga agilis]